MIAKGDGKTWFQSSPSKALARCFLPFKFCHVFPISSLSIMGTWVRDFASDKITEMLSPRTPGSESNGNRDLALKNVENICLVSVSCSNSNADVSHFVLDESRVWWLEFWKQIYFPTKAVFIRTGHRRWRNFPSFRKSLQLFCLSPDNDCFKLNLLACQTKTLDSIFGKFAILLWLKTQKFQTMIWHKLAQVFYPLKLVRSFSTSFLFV